MDIQNNNFITALKEYSLVREETSRLFIEWIIKMWAVLYTYRDTLKKEWRWLEFCEQIGIHISQANQQIRMYELSIDNNRMPVIENTITNWAKLNSFMSLNEEWKNTILDRVEEWVISTNIWSQDFREEIDNIKNKDLWNNEVVSSHRNIIHEDSRNASDLIQKTAGLHYTTKPFLEA